MNSVDLIHTIINLRPDGIVEIRCSENHQYELDEVIEVTKETGKLTGGKKMPTMTVPGKYSSASREALDYIFSDASIEFASHDAYIAQSLPQRLIGNFYLNIKKPVIPTRLFNDEQSALQWLEKMKSE